MNRLLFFLNFLKHPLRNASITPSSRAASEAMLKNIDFSSIDTILELGPGTGPFTEELLRHSKPESRIILVEVKKTYTDALQKKFGDKVTIVNSSVEFLDQVLKTYNIIKVDLLISGLPFLPKKAEGGFFEILKKLTAKGTIFRFFTYMPPVMKRVYKELPVRKIAFVAKNIPPLWVYGIN